MPTVPFSSMILVSVLVATFLLAFWKSFRPLFFKSPINNIPGPAPTSFWKGSFDQLFSPDGWEFHKEISEKYGSVIKIPSFLGDNWLYIFDPKAMHHIAVKEQYVFEETSSFIEGNKIMFGHGLLGTLGEQHRKQRKMLNPVFSIKHMKEMIPIFYNVGFKLRGTIFEKVKNGPQEIDILYWMSRTALELIGQSGFGHSFDSLSEDQVTHEYAKSYKQLVPAAFKFLFVRNYFLSTLVKIGTPKFRRFIVDMIPARSVQELKKLVDIIHNTSVMIYESKKKAISEGNETNLSKISQGKDIMSILIKANMNAREADSLTEEEVLGQMSTLTAAATDTTSGALSRTLYLLAQNPDVQEKLRAEILHAKSTISGEQFDYSQLDSLPYLDAICRETLRRYSPVSMISKTTRKDTVIPLSKPIKGIDGKEIHEIPIPNNTNVVVGIAASNCNPELWGPDSYEWKPERWLKPLPKLLTEAHIPGVYSNLMTFFAGGRACIGFKFSQLEMKVVLVLLIESFRFYLPDNKEIGWKMLGIATPVVINGGTTSHGQLPLVIERI